MNPKHQRRHIVREYSTIILGELFSIPKDEFIFELKWDRDNNLLVIETIKNFDIRKGDI